MANILLGGAAQRMTRRASGWVQKRLQMFPVIKVQQQRNYRLPYSEPVDFHHQHRSRSPST